MGSDINKFSNSRYAGLFVKPISMTYQHEFICRRIPLPITRLICPYIPIVVCLSSPSSSADYTCLIPHISSPSTGAAVNATTRPLPTPATAALSPPLSKFPFPSTHSSGLLPIISYVSHDLEVETDSATLYASVTRLIINTHLILCSP